jgi:hypothetical protein
LSIYTTIFSMSDKIKSSCVHFTYGLWDQAKTMGLSGTNTENLIYRSCLWITHMSTSHSTFCLKRLVGFILNGEAYSNSGCHYLNMANKWNLWNIPIKIELILGRIQHYCHPNRNFFVTDIWQKPC